MCSTTTSKQKKLNFLTNLTNFRILLKLSHVCEWWNLQRQQFTYNIENIVTIVPRGNATKETNNSWSIKQRKNCSAEKTLETVYYQSKGLCKNLKTKD